MRGADQAVVPVVLLKVDVVAEHRVRRALAVLRLAVGLRVPSCRHVELGVQQPPQLAPEAAGEARVPVGDDHGGEPIVRHPPTEDQLGGALGADGLIAQRHLEPVAQPARHGQVPRVSSAGAGQAEHKVHVDGVARLVGHRRWTQQPRGPALLDLVPLTRVAADDVVVDVAAHAGPVHA